ncbi:MAG: NHL repeat-containing protein [Planctomycetaceae bacterium]|nr:NHL repeat-containing protein [Planctomycetaceae bacterium]
MKLLFAAITILTGLWLAPGVESADAVIAPPRFVTEWGQPGDGDGEFHAPIGIAMDRHDVLYVTEFHNHRVQKFTRDGKFIGKFSVAEHPGGIAVAADDTVFVAPMLLHKIVVYDASGKLLREFGRQGSGDGEFNEPGGMLFGPDGLLYVADQSNHRIQVFDTQGKFIRQFGGYGTAVGSFGGMPTAQGKRFAGPHFVAFDERGELYTTEGALGRIQRLTKLGEPRFHWGRNDTNPGGFGGRETASRNALPGPIGIALDPRGRVWVSSSNSRVQCFSPQGEYLTGLVDEGSEPGQLRLPHGLVFDRDGFLYVVDSSNQRIQKFRP